MAPTKLSLAVCLFPLVTPSDYQGPIELLTFLSEWSIENNLFPTELPVIIDVTYLAATMDPVKGASGPLILPTKTYADADGEQFDILLIPGGPGTRPEIISSTVLEFVKRQSTGAKYVLSVCTGSEILAASGVVNGFRATTNKWDYKRISTTYKDVAWVPKARWVVDGKFWTSSGVTAGSNMAYAFVKHLAGHEIAEVARGVVELGLHDQEDDEFATIHGLV